MKIHLSSLVYASILLSSSYNVVAQTTVPLAEHIATVVDAKPIERVAPNYPRLAAKNGQEGWTRVSFVIDKQGNVIDPIIQDTSGLNVFNKEALKAIKEWKYSPAMQDGEAIEQCQMQVQMDFVMDKQKGVTRKFMKRYHAITDAITNKDLSQAAVMLEDLSESQLWNHSESTYFYLADAVYAQAVADKNRELRSVNRALNGAKHELKSNSHLYLLERQFILNLNSQQYLNALESFANIHDVSNNQALLAKLQPYAEQVSQLVKSEELLQMQATIYDGGQFYHKLSRNKFSLAIEQGSLDEVEIRCANKRSRFTVETDNEWHIPSSWGQCTIFVTGTPDTQFYVLELGAYVGDI